MIHRLTKRELANFIYDIKDYKVFTSAHLTYEELEFIPLVFMPVYFGLFEQLTPTEKAEVGILWEHMEEASTHVHNDRPIFYSCNILHIKDWDLVCTEMDFNAEKS